MMISNKYELSFSFKINTVLDKFRKKVLPVLPFNSNGRDHTLEN